MRVYLMVRPRLLKDFPEQARRAESLGYDGITMLELTVPPTLSAVASALNSTRIDLLTGIFVAFPRSPMATAYDAWSIQSLSNGRFQLGLGAQTKSHLSRRWSTEVVPPVPRMREYVESLRAIWDCWQNGTRLAYEGEHYHFSMMIPYYDPGPIEHPHVPIYLAAINKFMCRLTGELADGHIPGDPVTASTGGNHIHRAVARKIGSDGSLVIGTGKNHMFLPGIINARDSTVTQDWW